MLTKIALKNIFRHNRRTAITLSVIVFGVTALILFGGYKEVSFHGLRESAVRGNLGHLQIYKEGYSAADSQKPLEYGLENFQQVRAEVETDSRVELSTAQINFMGLITNGEKSEAFYGAAVEPSRDKKMPSQIMKAGEYLPSEDGDDIILGELMARSLKVQPGDSLTLMTTTVEGSLNGMDVRVAGTFTTGIKEYDQRAIKVPLAMAQRLLHTQKVERLLVLLEKTEDTAEVQRSLQSAFSSHQWKLEMKTWSQLATFYHQVVTLYNGIFGFIGMVVFVIVVLSVANTIMMSIFERTREIGTLMAIGTRRRRVWALFLMEGLLVGVLGGAIGLALGSGLAMGINSAHIQMPPPPGSSTGYSLEIMLKTSILLTAFILAVGTATMSSILPAFKASRLKIVDALGHV